MTFLLAMAQRKILRSPGLTAPLAYGGGHQAGNQAGRRGAKIPRKFFAPPGKICWT